jgi:hypothetical protein
VCYSLHEAARRTTLPSKGLRTLGIWSSIGSVAERRDANNADRGTERATIAEATARSSLLRVACVPPSLLCRLSSDLYEQHYLAIV